MRASWDEAEAVLARIPEDRMLEPGVTGEWSVRDLLAHIAGYERYVSALIFGELEGRTPTNQDFYGRDDPPTPEDDANDDTSQRLGRGARPVPAAAAPRSTSIDGRTTG